MTLTARSGDIELGVISHERNQVGVKHSHNEDTADDGRNSKGQRFGLRCTACWRERSGSSSTHHRIRAAYNWYNSYTLNSHR